MAHGLKTITALFLEDNPDDVDLELHELRKGGFEVIPAVARNREEFLEQLAAFAADIIIADYSLPDFNGIEAIRLCQQRNIEAPVILVSGLGSEQLAVDSLREGATDYICKSNIATLAVRANKALAMWADRQDAVLRAFAGAAGHDRHGGRKIPPPQAIAPCPEDGVGGDAGRRHCP
jgi:DNA-binding response OmpR family regulator